MNNSLKNLGLLLLCAGLACLFSFVKSSEITLIYGTLILGFLLYGVEKITSDKYGKIRSLTEFNDLLLVVALTKATTSFKYPIKIEGYLEEYTLGTITLTWIILSILKKRKITNLENSANGITLFLLLVLWCSMLGNFYHTPENTSILRDSTILILLVAISNNTETSMKAILWTLSFCTIIYCALNGIIKIVNHASGIQTITIVSLLLCMNDRISKILAILTTIPIFTLTASATSKLGGTILWTVTILSKLINNKKTKVLGLILSTTLFILTIIEKNKILALLNKSDTLSGRTKIWELTIPWIQEKWLTGYGDGFWKTFGNIYTENVLYFFSPHAHNYYIQLLTTSGTIGLILYLTMILTFTLNTNLSQRKKLLLILASIICSLTEARDLGIWRCETVTSTFIIFCIWASKKNHPKSVD